MILLIDNTTNSTILDEHNVCVDLRMLPLVIGNIYEDYFDWSDSHRYNHLQNLISALR